MDRVDVTGGDEQQSEEEWTEEENDILTHAYPHADRLEVLKALPERSWESIIKQASFKGIARYTRLNTSGIADTAAYACREYYKVELTGYRRVPRRRIVQ